MTIWLTEIWQAWRASLRKPGFLLLASGVLALGIGASVAVFALIDQVLMQPLPLPQASRLVAVGTLDGGDVSGVSPQQYQHLQSLQGVRSIGLVEDASVMANIAGGGAPEQVPMTYVDHQLLPTLGLHMQLGRNFSAAEDAPNGPKVVILGHGFWLRRFGGNPGVVGQTMQVEGVPHVIIGVLPASFSVVGSGDIVLPVALPPDSTDDGVNYYAFARLDDGVTTSALAAQVDARLHAFYVATGDKYWMRGHFGAQDFKTWNNAGVKPMLVLFLGCGLFVLLIALVNLTNLMLLRALSRSHDAAVRSALGAPSLRLVLPALAEGLLVGFVGALLGTGLALAGMMVLRGLLPAEWLNGVTLHFGAGLWVLGAGIGLLGALLAAGLGLWRGHAAGVLDELREGGRSGIGARNGRLGRALVVIQMALATGLLCAAGVFLHTLYDAARTPPGFSSGHILAFDLAPVRAEYPDASSVDALSQRLVRQLEAIPGVKAAVVTTSLPAGSRIDEQFNIGIHAPGGESYGRQFRGVGTGFFKLFDIPVLRGRAFTRDDVRGGEQVAVVNQALADSLYGGHALGQLIQNGSGADLWSARIVGVVGNTRQFGSFMPAPGIVYVPLAQMRNDIMQVFRGFSPIRFVLRVQGDPYGYRRAVQQAVALVAPDQPIANLRSMRDVLSSTTAPLRLNLLLVGIFAALALLLAAAGMYAVMAVAVAAREREFGVRMALGATPARLLALVLRNGLVQIGVGLLLGVALSLSLTGVLRAVMEQLADARGFDPFAIAGVCLMLALVGVLACLLPALRASRVPPMRALRGE